MNKAKDSSLTSFKKSIYRLIKERASIIWIKSCDKELVFDLLRSAIGDGDSDSININKANVTTWNIANGLLPFGSHKNNCVSVSLKDVLKQLISDEGNFTELLILDDISNLLVEQAEKNEIIGLLQEFAFLNSRWSTPMKKKWDCQLVDSDAYTPKNNDGIQPINSRSIIIISPQLEIVENLKHLIEIVEEPIPDIEDIMHELGFDIIEENPEILKLIAKDKTLKGKYCHARYKFSKGFMRAYPTYGKKLVSSLHGMYLYEIRRLLYSLQIHSDSEEQILKPYEEITKRPLHDFISDEKKRLVQNSGLLQVIDIDNDKQKDRVGNINNLRNFLDTQKKIINNIEKYNPQMRKPKGILLVGAPGCGKSEAAKSVAAILEKPLLRLDIGALMGQYVGVSEHNLIEAIRIAEAAAPCVLWIDEIEKAFAGFSNTDTGNDITVMRMVGYFLTWMQERKSLVYLVATANRLDDLRPELLRKGRWDKIMYLSYPDKKGIVDIFNKCLSKYHLKLDVSSTINGSGQYENKSFEEMVSLIYDQEMSGADIDSIIVEAYNSLFISANDSSVGLDTIKISECIKIVRAANTLNARKEADDELVSQSLLNYKISHGRFEWDIDKNTRINRALTEHRLTSGAHDFSLPESELIEDAISDLKISTGETSLRNESSIRNLVKKKIQKAKAHSEKIEKLIREKIDAEDKEHEAIENLIREQISHKSREKEEKYYRSKGYESAS
jgi:ATP-dependent 26S proteasome regulatory subunit